MTPDAVRELWVRFVAGEALPVDEQAALVAALDADPALRAELLEDVQLDGSLRAMGDARRSGTAFIASVAACVGPERDATRFVRKVEARLADLPPEPVGPGRDSRSNLPRISRRFHRRDSASTGWMAALAAASAIFALILLSAVVGRPPQIAATPKAPAPVPVPPAPRPGPPPVVEPPPAEPKRLGDIRRELETLEKTPAANPEDRARRVDDLRKEREAIEKDMREEIERRRAAPSPPPPDPEGTPRPPASTVTEKALAEARGPKVVRVVDQLYFVGGQKRVPVGHVLIHGQAIYTAGAGEADLEYPDGTSVQVRRDSTVKDLSDARGQRFFLVQGSIGSKISKQPAGKPMVFETVHAEASILGTEIRLSVNPRDPALGTTLSVIEGKVSFKRLSDEEAIEVTAGRSATATTSREKNWKTRVPFPELIQMNFGPADAKIAGWYLDSGEPFDPSRGYGWVGPKVGDAVFTWVDTQGKEQKKNSGREATRRQGNLRADDPGATCVAAGWGEHTETWKIELPNGRYLVTVTVGDPTFEQGPHLVSLQGQAPVINMVITNPPKSFHEAAAVVDVKDGELTMKVGGYPGAEKSPADNSRDTILNCLTIRRVPAAKK